MQFTQVTLVCTSSILCLLPTIPHGPYFSYSPKLLTHLTVSHCRLYNRDLHSVLYARVFTRYCYQFLRPLEDNKRNTHTHTRTHTHKDMLQHPQQASQSCSYEQNI